MQNYWLSFVNHLDPNKSPSASNQTRWEMYDKNSSSLIFLNKGSKMIKDDFREDGIEYIISLGLGEVRFLASLVRDFDLIDCKLDPAGLMSEGKGFL